MNNERWTRIEKKIASEKEFLAGFKAASTAETVTAEGLGARGAMYADAAYSTYQNNVLQRESDFGVTLVRRICADDEASCEACVEAATEEFIPLAEVSDIGSLTCMSNCRCDLEFSHEGIEFRTSDLFQGVVGGQDAFGGSVAVQ